MKKAAILLLLFILALPCYGQCVNGICPAPAINQPSNVQLYEGWYEGKDGWVDLYSKGVFVGSLRFETCDWKGIGRPMVNLPQAFGKVAKIGQLIRPKECVCKEGKCDCQDCPRNCVAVQQKFGQEVCKESEACKLVEGGIPNFGMDWHADGKEKYSLNGQEVPKRHAFAAIAGETGVPDDSKLARLVVLGSLPARQKVMADLQSDFGLLALKDKLVAQSYDPSHWHVKDAGYVAKADPTIYLTAPDGKVLHRQDGYDGPAKLSQAIRKADPTYDPNKDKDLNKTDPSNPAQPINWNIILLVCAIGAGLYWARKNGKI